MSYLMNYNENRPFSFDIAPNCHDQFQMGYLDRFFDNLYNELKSQEIFLSTNYVDTYSNENPCPTILGILDQILI